MDKRKFQEFLESETGRYVTLLVLIIPAIFVIYFIHFKDRKTEEKMIDNGAGITVAARDTIWNSRKGVYYNKEKKKKISSDKKFFYFDGLDQLKEIVNSNEEQVEKKAEPKKIEQKPVTKKVVYRRKKIKPKKTEAQKRQELIASFQKSTKEEFERYYGTNSNSEEASEKPNNTKKIYAVINGDHIVKDHSRIELRLENNVTIDGKQYNKNTVLYADAEFTKNRILLNIDNIQGNTIKLKCYDAQDGRLGIYSEALVSNEVYRDGVNDIADEVNINGVPVVGTVKQIFKRKNKEEKVSLWNNYRVLLKS